MKKRTIWVISIVMGLSFAALLYLQVRYFEQVLTMRKEQFDSSVSRSLTQVSRELELEETMKALKDDFHANQPADNRQKGHAAQSLDDLGMDRMAGRYKFGRDDSIASKLKTMPAHTATLPKGIILRNQTGNVISNMSQKMREEVKSRYLYQRILLDKVIYNILYTSSEKPLKDCINFKMLDLNLKAELLANGINIPYHFAVTTRSGNVLYRCPDYSPEGEEYAYKQILMPNNPPSNTGILIVHFPTMKRYLFQSVKFMLPSIIFTLILLITFIITIVIAFRQKKLSEIKNDFINNMTHELKTPVASISLAVQMLLDKSVPKTEKMTAHLSGIISDETKRLQMLIEKVLQTSVLEGQKVSYKNREIDANKLVAEVANTFELKVSQLGGSLETDINAPEAIIFGDQMHVTNVLFNLMDNAVKYRREEIPFHLKVSTRNEHGHLVITIEDNGRGIKKENLKKIFDKFYRVHTGNRHDVKGFGLGLAYVKGIVDAMHGTIHAESEYGSGTRFIINLPIIKE